MQVMFQPGNSCSTDSEILQQHRALMVAVLVLMGISMFALQMQLGDMSATHSMGWTTLGLLFGILSTQLSSTEMQPGSSRDDSNQRTPTPAPKQLSDRSADSSAAIPELSDDDKKLLKQLDDKYDAAQLVEVS